MSSHPLTSCPYPVMISGSKQRQKLCICLCLAQEKQNPKPSLDPGKATSHFSCKFIIPFDHSTRWRQISTARGNVDRSEHRESRLKFKCRPHFWVPSVDIFVILKRQRNRLWRVKKLWKVLWQQSAKQTEEVPMFASKLGSKLWSRTCIQGLSYCKGDPLHYGLQCIYINKRVGRSAAPSVRA